MNVSKEDLKYYYITLDKSREECMDHFELSKWKIGELIRKYKLYKPKIKITKKELKNQYITLNKSQKECAKHFNCGVTKIEELVKEYELKKTSKKIREKVKKTNQENYGVDNPSQIDWVKKKKKETCLKNYGVEIPLQSEEIKEKVKKTNQEKYGTRHPNRKNIKNIDIWEEDVDLKRWIKNKSKKLERKISINELCVFFNISDTALYMRFKKINDNKFLEKYTKLNSIFSKKEELIKNWLENNNINYIWNKDKNWEIIHPYEVDFIIPDKKICIEMNDTWTHNVEFMMKYKNRNLTEAKNYHNMKTELCEKNGYRLIHIFEKDLEDLDNMLNVLLPAKKINARDLKYKHDYEVKKFIIENHKQHTCNKKLGGALINNEGEIVGAITFKKHLDNLVLEKLCFKKGYNVRGGASKLFKNYIKEANNKGTTEILGINKIITYCDTTYHSGRVYEELGFKIDKVLKPMYFWVKNDEWIFRRSFQKHLLKKRFNLEDEYIKTHTEREICNELGYVSIYTSNQIKYIYKLN